MSDIIKVERIDSTYISVRIIRGEEQIQSAIKSAHDMTPTEIANIQKRLQDYLVKILDVYGSADAYARAVKDGAQEIHG